MTIRLYDLSSIQGHLTSAHWEAIAKSGIRGVSLRCGNGNNAPDSMFATNLANARAVGLVVQAYNVVFPLPPDPRHPNRAPEEQAALHFEQSMGLGRGTGELAPACDLEWPEVKDWAEWGVGPRFIVRWALDYLEAVAERIGRDPYLYLYPEYAKQLRAGADLVPLTRYSLWGAEYEVKGQPYPIPPWSEFKFWQTSGGGGKLPNDADVDEDVFLGTEAEFAAAANLPASDVTNGGQDRPVHPAIEPEEKS